MKHATIYTVIFASALLSACHAKEHKDVWSSLDYYHYDKPTETRPIRTSGGMMMTAPASL